MHEKVIREITTPEKVYTNNADDKFMMQIHFAMAKKSSDDTSQFVRRDVESKLLKGEYPSIVPPGYLNINRDGHITKSRDDPEKYLLLLKLNRPLAPRGDRPDRRAWSPRHSRRTSPLPAERLRLRQQKPRVAIPERDAACVRAVPPGMWWHPGRCVSYCLTRRPD